MQRRQASRTAPSVDVGSLTDQRLYHGATLRFMPLNMRVRRVVERIVSQAVSYPDIRAMLQEHLNARKVPPTGGMDQQRASVPACCGKRGIALQLPLKRIQRKMVAGEKGV